MTENRKQLYAYLDTSVLIRLGDDQDPILSSAERRSITELLDARYRVLVSFCGLWETSRPWVDSAKRKRVLSWLCERDPSWLRFITELVEYEVFMAFGRYYPSKLGKVTDPYWVIEDYRQTFPNPYRWANPGKLSPSGLLESILREQTKIDQPNDSTFERTYAGMEYLHDLRLNERLELAKNSNLMHWLKRDKPWWEGMNGPTLNSILRPLVEEKIIHMVGLAKEVVSVTEDDVPILAARCPSLMNIITTQLLLWQSDLRKKADRNIDINDMPDLIHLSAVSFVDLLVTDDKEMIKRAMLLKREDSPVPVRSLHAIVCRPSELLHRG